jgi:predicted transcriptional regulator
LPDIHGPCVCGDPCWIGPQGNGCDYALYTPESKKALLADRELLITQIRELEKKSPGHPRLGQWKARVERIDQLIKEIESAEERAAAGEPVERPREKLVPHDPPFEPIEQPSTQRSARQRRREAALKASKSFKRVREVEPLQEIDAQTLAQARSILQELEVHKIPITIQGLAKRLGIAVRHLYNCPEICDSLSGHNRRCSLTPREVMETQLKELSAQEKIVGCREFAKLCGLPQRALFKSYSEWSGRLAQQNRAIRTKHLHRAADQRLQELVNARRGETVRAFAKSIGISVNSLRKTRSDIVKRLVQHNKALDLRERQSAREKRIAFIYNCWNAAVQRGEHLNLCQLCERCHLSPMTIRRHCPEIIAELHEPPKGT